MLLEIPLTRGKRGAMYSKSKFLETLKCNYVYDMGFRCNNKVIKLCWCPW